jgi:hypothetical protein
VRTEQFGPRRVARDLKPAGERAEGGQDQGVFARDEAGACDLVALEP